MSSVLLATTLAAVLAQAPAAPQTITFQGCVTPGADRDSYVITGVTQVSGSDSAEVPQAAHGRRVLFWLDNDADVRSNVGRRVEVTGTIAKIEESEIEIKAGRQDTGGLVVEFEGPGPDVRSAAPEVATAVGTAGREAPEQNDVKTYLLRLRVDDVKTVAGACQ